jgi:putative ABC transport system ATP-binding protein
MTMVTVDRLAKAYISGGSRQTVFDALGFSIAKGETFALLGASGSGKTTLLNLISGIDRPDSGKVLLEGVDVHALEEPERTLLRRRRIGFVFQFFNLIPTLTVGENVSLPLELNRVPRSQAHIKAQNLLETVGLLDRWETFPEKLSGGEQQRVALARALVHDPLLILADEPTGNLDEENGAQVISLLARLTREQGRTLLLVTHSRETASHADRVLRLSHGQLVTER